MGKAVRRISGQETIDSAHEIYGISSDMLSMTYTGGALKVKESSRISGYGVRVLEKNRLGFSYCQKEDDIQEAIKRAKILSKASPKSGFSFSIKSKYDNLDIFDRSIDPNDIEAYKGIVDQIRDAAASFKGEPRVMLTASRSKITLENSAGFIGSYKRTNLTAYVEAMDGDGYGYDYISATKSPKIDKFISIGSNAAQMAKDMKGAKKPDPGSYLVVMELDTLSSLLDTLMPSFSGDWKRRKMTKLVNGDKTFSEKLTLSEDGLAPGTDARPFDDEGTVSKRREMIGKGYVRSFLYDRETAALAKTKGCGSCSRDSFESVPYISPSNLVIDPGNVKDLAELGRHIEVHSAHGAHTANPTNGDIGLEVTVAFLSEMGVKKPVRNFMLSANVFDLFRDIEAVESKQQIQGDLISPRIAFRSVKVVS